MKEIVNNSIDEFRMHFGNNIEIELRKNTISVRDFERGIQQGKMIYAVSLMLYGCRTPEGWTIQQVKPGGARLANALSASFTVKSFRDGMVKQADFVRGKLVNEYDLVPTTEKNGTYVEITPDEEIFGNYKFHKGYLEGMVRKFSYTNIGLTLNFNGKKFLIEK